MSAADWLALAVACAAGAMSPGPSLALVIRHASLSPRAGLICAASHALGVGVYAALAASGLALALQSSRLGLLVAGFGCLWLLWLALQLWRDPGHARTDAAHPGFAARDGLLMGLVNPKVALFFLAIFSAVLPAGAGPAERGAAVGMAVLIDASWYALVALLLQGAGTLAWLRRRGRLINRLSALIFVALAVMIVRGLME